MCVSAGPLHKTTQQEGREGREGRDGREGREGNEEKGRRQRAKEDNELRGGELEGFWEKRNFLSLIKILYEKYSPLYTVSNYKEY